MKTQYEMRFSERRRVIAVAIGLPCGRRR